MICSNFSKLSVSVLLATSSFGQVAANHTPGSIQCTKPYFKEHKVIAAILAVLSTAALVAKPTKGDHALTQEAFIKSPGTFMLNAFGWFPKDPKIIEVDEETFLPIYKPGYEGQGLVGAVHKLSKELAPLTGLILLIKAIESWCQMANIFKEEVPTKIA